MKAAYLKNTAKLKSAVMSLTAAMLLTACFNLKPKVNPVDPEFGKYITGYTSGMLTRKTTIRIELAQPPGAAGPLDTAVDVASAHAATLARMDPAMRQLPDSSLLNDIFSFEPAIKGRAVWISERVIEFIPTQPLPANQFYNAEFKLEKLRRVPVKFEVFPFQFSTYPQNLFVTIDGLRTYDSYRTDLLKLTGKITTSDYEDTASLRKTITVTSGGKTMPINWTHSYRANEFYFYVDKIEREEKEGLLAVNWNGEPIHAVASGRQQLLIPAMGDFSVTDARVIDNEDQHIALTFSDPIRHNQNLKGIVSIQGTDNLTFSIDGNVVKVFLPGRIEGERLLTVTSGMQNFKGYKMNAAYSQSITFDAPKPLVRIKGNGCILPNSNGLIFPFEAISLKAVDVRVIKIFANNVHQFLQVNNLDGGDELTRVGKVVAERKVKLDYEKSLNLKQWNKHVLDLGKLIEPEPGAIYRVSIKFGKEDAICACDDGEENGVMEGGAEQEISSAADPQKSTDGDWSERHWRSYGNFGGGYDRWYYYDENYSPCDHNYYYGKAVSRNILASDLGLIYKLDDNKMSHAFVSDMLTAKPLAGVALEYYDYARQLVASGLSDASGMLDVQLKRKPFLLLAKYGRQRGYLKLLDGYTNSLSKFDVGGEMVQKGVKGLIYGERGVWRPGDSLFLTFIMEDKEKRLPPGHPVKFELQDPAGAVVYQTTKTKNVNGMYDFRTATGVDAPTGNYTAVARIGNRAFRQTIKVETVKPNRLKIYMDFGKKAEDSLVKLSVKWLHGATAKNLFASVNVNVNQAKTVFDKFKSYEFDSPVRNYYADAVEIWSGKLGEKGEATFANDLSVGSTAPGMLRATYVTKVFEEGGDFSIDRYSIPYSPYKRYVGLHVPEKKGQGNSLETGVNYKFDVVTVNENGKLVNSDKLLVKIYKIQWRWWYERSEEDLANYISRAGTLMIKDTLINTRDGRGAFSFKVEYPEYGRYLITVTDPNGGHETGKVVTIDWPYWRRGNRSGSENANMLNFACDKEKYTTGEKIKISFPSPAEGLALVSIETGTRVVNKFWITTKKGETTHEIPATKEMSPNAYVHVTLLQPHASTKNDLPIRMYGVVPVTVDDPLTHLAPEIKMPGVVKPESTTQIRVKEKEGRKMNYTLAMVDEGLLDLTRFKTPQPWNTFYAREALGVKTWDMYDAVLGAYAGSLDKLLSIGGDGSEDVAKGVKANRFKPVVKFQGPFTLEAGQERTHTVDIPNYVGSVRVMVVAEHEGAYGNAEKTVAVRKPLMLLATLPRVLGPQETVSLPVDVFAMENHVKDVSVTVEVNDMLTIEGDKKQTMRFRQTGDEVINFNLKVAPKIGVAKVKITATSGNEKAVQEIELDVRTPNPKVADGSEMVLEPGKEWNTAIAFKGIPGTNQATIEFSSIPSLGLEKRLDYLIRYPHGCIEQTTSSVFTQLYVSNLMEMKEGQKSRIAHNVKAGLKRLQLFQTSNGGFSYWPGEGYDSEWGSNYAGHFMIEAEKGGYSLPHNMKKKWVKYQQQQARSWSNHSNPYSHAHGTETNEMMQAYRLFVLALSGNAEMGAMNRLREERNLSTTARWRLAAAYKLVGQTEVALRLIDGLPTDVKPYKELSYSYGSDTRDEAMILETLSLLDRKEKAWPLAKQLAKTLNSETWLSTQETAYGLLAMCQYAGVRGSAGEMSFSYSVSSCVSGAKTSKKTLYQVKYTDKDLASGSKLSVKNTGKSTLFTKVIIEGVPLAGDKSAASHDLQMEVRYTDMKGKEISPDKIQQGTDFVAEVTITNPGTKGFLKEMALSQIFPSGWEIHNARMDGYAGSNAARYQDIRDDRVYTYYDLPSGNTKKFVVQLNATYLGKFYLPTVYSEAMYDNTVNARVPGRWVEVVKEMGVVAGK